MIDQIELLKLVIISDISLGLHFSKYLKKETVQKSPLSKQHKNKHKSKNNATHDFLHKFGKDIRNKNNNHKKSQAVISSNKLRKKYDTTTRKKLHGASEFSSKRSKNGRFISDEESGRNGSFATPLENSMPSGTLQRRRRSSQNDYDINNIVIPYSIASTTRVEKLEYKEIMTPKWRILEKYGITDDVEKMPETESYDIEDLSDETIAIRHMKCEVDEKKRFLTFIKFKMNSKAQLLNQNDHSISSELGSRRRTDSTNSVDNGIRKRFDSNNSYEHESTKSIENNHCNEASALNENSCVKEANA